MQMTRRSRASGRAKRSSSWRCVAPQAQPQVRRHESPNEGPYKHEKGIELIDARYVHQAHQEHNETNATQAKQRRGFRPPETGAHHTLIYVLPPFGGRGRKKLGDSGKERLNQFLA